jgi:predicted GNAT family acetyltransferase
VLTITHTFVPPALEGRGIAGQLTDAVLNTPRAAPQGAPALLVRTGLHTAASRDAV